jgi:hypothetical protein
MYSWARYDVPRTTSCSSAAPFYYSNRHESDAGVAGIGRADPISARTRVATRGSYGFAKPSPPIAHELTTQNTRSRYRSNGGNIIETCADSYRLAQAAPGRPRRRRRIEESGRRLVERPMVQRHGVHTTAASFLPVVWHRPAATQRRRQNRITCCRPDVWRIAVAACSAATIAVPGLTDLLFALIVGTGPAKPGPPTSHLIRARNA